MEYISREGSLRILYKIIIPEHLREYQGNIKGMRQADLTQLDAELREKGSSIQEKIDKEIIFRMQFPGIVYAVDGISSRRGTINMCLHPIHPYRADLAYKRDPTLENNPGPLSISGLIESREGTIFGLRAGSVEQGKIGFVPGGHAEYRGFYHQEDIGIRALQEETEEELGITPPEYSIEEIFGIHKNPDTNGTDIIATMKTGLSLEEIEKRREKAKDRWEHSRLVAIAKEDLFKRELGAFEEYSFTKNVEAGIRRYIERYRQRA